jgi:hypothetical protein
MGFLSEKFKDHRAALILLSVFLLSGLSIVGDYGITWDEKYQRDYGFHVFNYVHHDDGELREYQSRYHGPAFQYLLYVAEHFAEPSDPGDVYRLRHVITFLFSVIGIGFFYLLLLQIFRRRSWALLGMALLILSPRIFAHSFYNSKDASFMYMFIIAMYTMVRMLLSMNLRSVTVHALACALLFDMRILGGFVPVFTALLMLPRFFWSLREQMSKVPLLLWCGLVFAVGAVAFWPTLWHSPAQELLNALRTMSAYPWEYGVRFWGEFVPSTQLPWFYLLLWMVITTPLVHIVLIALGGYAWVADRNRLTTEHFLMVLLWATMPLAVVVGKGAVVYDGWRHVFFVWPAFVLIAVAGARWVIERMGKRMPAIVVWALLVVAMSNPLLWLVRNHPHQAAFFNVLAVKNAWQHYEMDYWGGCFKQALEWLAENCEDEEITIYPAHLPGELNLWMLSTEQRKRFRQVELGEARYMVSNYRYQEHLEAMLEHRYPYEHPMHVITVDGNLIVGVYRLR